MFNSTPIYHQLLVTIQLDTPMAIGQGYGETGFDVVLLRDANGLPTIAGSTLAGMLRDAMSRDQTSQLVEALFGGGADNRGRSDIKEGRISNLQISFAHVHNADNQPVVGLLAALDTTSDAVLALLAEDHPVTRERVRLNDRGAAADTGKYDVSAVPAGTRFSFEISAWFDNEQPAEWQALVQLLQRGDLRIGRGKRSGFGAFHVQGLTQRCCDLTRAEGRQRFAEYSAEVDALAQPLPARPENEANSLYRIRYQSDGLLRMGGNGGTVTAMTAEQRTPDLLTQVEDTIVWRNNRGQVERMVVIPGSAIKGALRHRFVYHINRLAQRFVPDAALQCPEADALFGFAKDNQPPAEKAMGQAGSLIIDDVFIPLAQVTPMVMQHNAIDRFTGGTIDGALYSEEGLWDVAFEFAVFYRPVTPATDDTLAGISARALHATIKDLVAGRLALGAGGSRGNGSANPDYSHIIQQTTDLEVAS